MKGRRIEGWKGGRWEDRKRRRRENLCKSVAKKLKKSMVTLVDISFSLC
jgi:hypothetical protein